MPTDEEIDAAAASDEMMALLIINALAPLTRRDEWWTTEYPLVLVKDLISEFRVALEAAERVRSRPQE